jgi:HK97 family phage major capsid protein
VDKLKELIKRLSDLDETIDAMLADEEGEPDEKDKEALAKVHKDRAKCLLAIGREKERLARLEEREQVSAEADTFSRVHAAAHAHDGRRTDASPQTTGASAAPTVAATAIDPAAVKRRGFSTPREFLQGVIDAGSGRRLDKRLVPLQATVGSDEQRGISDPYGGFMVPEAFSPDFLKVDPEADPMAPYVRRIPMGSPTLRIPARTDKNHTSSVSGGLTVTRRPETVAGTSSVMTMEQVVMQAQSLFGLAYATEEMLTDSPQSFIAILEAGFNDQFTYKLIQERINGNGVGEFEGILKSPALVSIAKEAGQAAATLVLQNVLNMRARCWGYQTAIWVSNHDCIPQLGVLNQSVGVAGTGMVWVPSFREDVPDVLLGRPLLFSEYASTLGTQGDLILFNGMEYLEGLYQPLESMESVHVRFTSHERALKFWLRNDGRGWWKTPLTPVNSSKTLSPFVVTDTRA